MNHQELAEKLERPEDSYKGMNGKVGVIGGSVDFSGAPALNAEAALRTGADLVKILTSSKVRDTVRGYSENFIVESYESSYFDTESLKKAQKLSEWSDVIVIGSGLSKPDEEALKKFAEASKCPLVIDAESIKPLIELDNLDAVFTPHNQEASIMREIYGSVKMFSREKNCSVVVTGSVDEIFVNGKKYLNTSGCSAMTVGGTGDVLAGVVASLVSQGLEPREASRYGAWLNGKAGEKAANRKGNGMLATDLVEAIPEVVNE